MLVPPPKVDPFPACLLSLSYSISPNFSHFISFQLNPLPSATASTTAPPARAPTELPPRMSFSLTLFLSYSLPLIEPPFLYKKKMGEAWHVIDLMRESQISPNLMAYNYLFMAYCFIRDLKPVDALLTRMAEEGLGVDTRTYDALVLAACRVGKVEGALALLRRMEDDGMPALYATHAHVITGLLRLGY